MPYIITTKQPEPLAPFDRPRDMIETSRTAVATLDEAREDVVATVEIAEDPDGPRLDSLWEHAHGMDESGGTIGPLPDGTVIEVRQVSRDELADELPVSFFDARDWPATDAAILAAFNGAQA
jgi:hypothetical protein